VIERTAAPVGYRYGFRIADRKHGGCHEFLIGSRFSDRGRDGRVTRGRFSANPSICGGVCPQFVTNYCVYNSHHLIFTAATNPCFAKERHWTVIYQGACKIRH
jgi:hypothetical protein